MSNSTKPQQYERLMKKVEAIQWDGTTESTEALKLFIGWGPEDRFEITENIYFDHKLEEIRTLSFSYISSYYGRFGLFSGGWVIKKALEGSRPSFETMSDENFRSIYRVEDDK